MKKLKNELTRGKQGDINQNKVFRNKRRGTKSSSAFGGLKLSLTGALMAFTYLASAQEYKVAVSGSKKLVINGVNKIEIEGATGSEIIFSTANRSKKTSERAEGLKAIGSWGLEVRAAAIACSDAMVCVGVARWAYVSAEAAIALVLGVTVLFQRGKVFQQRAVDEDVAAADFAQQHPLGSIIEEAGITPGHVARAGEHRPQREVPDKGDGAITQPSNQPKKQPKKQPNNQPKTQPSN